MNPDTLDRVRDLTATAVNRRIDEQSERQILQNAAASHEQLRNTILELEREWDFERVLEAEAATMGLIGIGLAVARGRTWLLLPGFVGAMILLHALAGPYPLLPLFRRAGVRTRDEIEKEKYALKAMRGDFADVAGEDQVARAKAAWRAVQL